jgi:hypothetical protein
MPRLGKILGVGLLGLVVTGMTLWGMGALLFFSPWTNRRFPAHGSRARL